MKAINEMKLTIDSRSVNESYEVTLIQQCLNLILHDSDRNFFACTRNYIKHNLSVHVTFLSNQPNLFNHNISVFKLILLCIRIAFIPRSP